MIPTVPVQMYTGLSILTLHGLGMLYLCMGCGGAASEYSTKTLCQSDVAAM